MVTTVSSFVPFMSREAAFNFIIGSDTGVVWQEASLVFFVFGLRLSLQEGVVSHRVFLLPP